MKKIIFLLLASCLASSEVFAERVFERRGTFRSSYSSQDGVKNFVLLKRGKTVYFDIDVKDGPKDSLVVSQVTLCSDNRVSVKDSKGLASYKVPYNGTYEITTSCTKKVPYDISFVLSIEDEARSADKSSNLAAPPKLEEAPVLNFSGPVEIVYNESSKKRSENVSHKKSREIENIEETSADDTYEDPSSGSESDYTPSKVVSQHSVDEKSLVVSESASTEDEAEDEAEDEVEDEAENEVVEDNSEEESGPFISNEAAELLAAALEPVSGGAAQISSYKGKNAKQLNSSKNVTKSNLHENKVEPSEVKHSSYADRTLEEQRMAVNKRYDELSESSSNNHSNESQDGNSKKIEDFPTDVTLRESDRYDSKMSEVQTGELKTKSKEDISSEMAARAKADAEAAKKIAAEEAEKLAQRIAERKAAEEISRAKKAEKLEKASKIADAIRKAEEEKEKEEAKIAAHKAAKEAAERSKQKEAEKAEKARRAAELAAADRAAKEAVALASMNKSSLSGADSDDPIYDAVEISAVENKKSEKIVPVKKTKEPSKNTYEKLTESTVAVSISENSYYTAAPEPKEVFAISPSSIFDYKCSFPVILNPSESLSAWPVSAQWDKEGNLWVLDSQLRKIRRFTSEGKLLNSFGEKGRAPGTLGLPVSISVNDSKIYVSDITNHSVYIFNYNGVLLKTLTGDVHNGLKLVAPGAVCFRSNEMWVPDKTSSGIVCSSEDGIFLGVFEPGTVNPLESPVGVRADERFLYVMQENGIMKSFDPAGNAESVVDTMSGEVLDFDSDPWGGFWVCDGSNGSVKRFNRKGTMLGSIASPSNVKMTWFPTSTSVRKDGLIAVTDAANKQVHIFVTK